VEISFDGLFANNLQKLLCKTCAIRFFVSSAFEKTKKYQNLTTENWSKQRFSLLQEKVVIQAVYPKTKAVSKKVLELAIFFTLGSFVYNWST